MQSEIKVKHLSSHYQRSMTQTTNSSHNSYPLSQVRTELAWKGKYGDLHEVDIAGSALPIQKIYQRLNTTPERVADFCEKWKIDEFALFGSVLRDDFRTGGDDPSDIDVLYTHIPQVKYGFEIFDMKEELEVLFARKVDFISRNSIQNSRNWLRRKTILESVQVIYAKRSAIAH